MRRVVVTGLGCLCPLGANISATWDALLTARSGIVALRGEEYARLPSRIAALVPLDAKVSTSYPRASALALLAAEEALRNSGWQPKDDVQRERTGVAVGIGMPDLEEVCRGGNALKNGYNKLSPYFVLRILPNMAAGHISIAHGFRGPNHSVSTACATGAHAVGDAYRFIRAGDADVMVCGGSEACIGPLALASFCRMRALSISHNDEPVLASRPFDRDRDGFVMGEGAAILVIEEYEHARRRDAHIIAEILGYGTSGDALHATSARTDGSGAKLSMTRALCEANLLPSDVGYINAHATSTPAGDPIEAAAIKAVFGHSVAVSASKGATGHLLGAAGALETLFSALAIEQGIIPPTLNLHSPLADLDFVALKPRKWSTTRRVALNNSFGFGGTNATICLANLPDS